MKPGELTRIEETLRRAYADAAAKVPDDLVPGVPVIVQTSKLARRADRPSRRRRWLVPAAAGAAVAVLALVAGLVVAPNEAQQQKPPRPAAASPTMAYITEGVSAAASGLTAASSVLPVDLVAGRTLRPIRLSVAGIPTHVVMAPNGRTDYVVTQGGDVVPIDTVTRRAEPPIRIGGVPTDITDVLISRDGRTGYVLEYPYGVATVNLVTSRPGRFIKIDNASDFALTPNGKVLYVVTEHGTQVVPINTATLRPLSPIMTGDYNTFLSARIGVAPDGRTVYLLSLKLGKTGQVLTPIRTATGTVLPSIPIAESALGAGFTISPDSRSAYIDTGSGVMAIDLMGRRIRWILTLGGPNAYYDVVISPDSQTVYTTDDGYDVDRVDATRGTRPTPVLSDLLVRDMAFGPGGKLYVLGERVTKVGQTGLSQTLTRFDPATGAVGRPINLPGGSQGSWDDLQFGG
jgi:DNA-binding beta-propeller fold protein YncE